MVDDTGFRRKEEMCGGSVMGRVAKALKAFFTEAEMSFCCEDLIYLE